MEISEHIIVDYNLVLVEYDKTKHMATYIFNGDKYFVDYYRIQKIFATLNKYVDILYDYGDVVTNYYIKNNKIWMDIMTYDGKRYSTTIQGLGNRLNTRKKFEKLLSENGDALISSFTRCCEHVRIQYSCGHKNTITPNQYMSMSSNCGICSHTIIQPYINDCFTLRKDLLQYFINPQDAIGVAVNDKAIRDFICPICNTKSKHRLDNISNFGFSCKNCGDGVSYPEKYMKSVLDQLKVNYKLHERPAWCKYKLNNVMHSGEYDFVIEDKKIIIEIDGGFHFIDSGSPWFQEDTIAKDRIKDKLASENGYTVIRIPANYNRNQAKADFMRESINKCLHTIFDFNNINWNDADLYGASSNLKDACNLWNQGYTVKEISKQLVINNVSIIEYLKRGNNLGLCEYTPELSNLRQAKNTSSKYYVYTLVLDKTTNDILGVFYDMDNFIYNYQKEHGIKIRKQSIREMIFEHGRSIRKSVSGLSFKKITKDKFDEYIRNNIPRLDISNCKYPIVMSNTDYTQFYE